MTTSSVSSSPQAAPTIQTGNAQNVSNLMSGGVTLSLADVVTTKVQPYLDQATSIQTEINTNQTQIAAYQNMQSLLQALQSSVANLTSEPLGGTNALAGVVANLTSNSATPASSILSGTVANGLAPATHTITVNQLAAAESDTSATLPLAATDSISNLTSYPGDGSITIAESGKSSPQAVPINAAMTLSEVAAAINDVSASNGVTASVVSVDSSHQVLVLSGQDPDQALNFTDSGSPGILQSLGLISSSLTGTTTDPTTATAGSFTINSGADAVPVTVNAGDSISTVATSINAAAVSAGSAITAADVNGQLVITGNANEPVSFSSVAGTALSSLGFAANGAANQATAAQAAIMTVDGVSGITRTTNNITDVLSGITLNLTQASPTTEVTLQVAPDTTGATNAINSFVTAYNSWENFVTQNEATASGGGAAAGAVLFGDSSLREASLQIDSAVTQTINSTSLGAFGISLNSSNQLVVDSSTLAEQMTTNFSTIANFFQSSITSSSGNLVPSSTNFSSYAGSFSLGITMSGTNISGLTLNGSDASSDFSFSGNSISGLAGSPYAGMYFTYNGNGETATVNATQGMANQLYTSTNNYGNPLNGSVQALITDKQNQDTQYTTEYNSWVNDANNYTNFLVQQYSSLSTQMQTAGTTLQTLNALVTAGNSANG